MGLNIKAKTIKFLEENRGVNLCDLGLSKALLRLTPKSQEKKIKVTWASSNTLKKSVPLKT